MGSASTTIGFMIKHPLTEEQNPLTSQIDLVSTLEMVQMMNQEDARVAAAVAVELDAIARAIDAIAARMQRGGRLIYMGAGTSGRLGVLDALECPPTFNTPPEMVVGLIAGSQLALTDSVETAEDDAEMGAKEIAELGVGANDTLVGIAASGSTPYVLGGIAEARSRGALTVSIACSRPSPLEQAVEIGIAPLVGAEAITGSTRLKAGTAQKMVLNMISTGVMIKLGKRYGHLLVDVQPDKLKLLGRARRMVAQACGIPAAQAAQVLEVCGGEVKTAIVSTLAEVSVEEARILLEQADGRVRQALAASRVGGS